MQDMVQQAGFEEILPVLIFFAVIVAQLIKAGKRLSGGPRPAPQAGPSEEPRDEIRDFLERLTGEKTEPPPPPPRTPVAAPVLQTVRAAPRPVRRAPLKPAPIARPTPRKAAGPAVSAQGALRRGFSWDATQRAELSVTPQREAIREALADRTALAQAVILREILDAPVSLRARS